MINSSKIVNHLQQCTLRQLKQIHALLITASLNQVHEIRLKFLRRTTEFGEMEYPLLIFQKMQELFSSDVTLWNAMIRGYAYNGPCENCLFLFDEMTVRGLTPNNFTYPYLLNSCMKLRDFRAGKKVHCRVITSGFENVFSVGNALFDLYVKMAESLKFRSRENEGLDDVRRIFDGVEDRTVELWNKMVWKYMSTGDLTNGRKVFDEMPERDSVSWNTMISGYAKAGDIANARNMFECMPEKNVVSWTTMVQAYAGAGDIVTARIVFDKMPDKNVVSWNCMMSSYNRIGKFRETMDLFVEMQKRDVQADSFTFVAALTACSSLNELQSGKWVHRLIGDWAKMGVIVGTALVEMYASCGDIDTSFTIFIKIGDKDVFSYNVMIKCLGLHGRTSEAIKMFRLMQKRSDLTPNEHTYLAALFACSHGGLVKEGQEIFEDMKTDTSTRPKLEHFCSMIDLLCRNDHLEEAQVLMKEMQDEPDTAVWGALLAGYKERGDINFAEGIVRIADELNPKESGVHVLLSNMLASMGRWSDSQRARRLMEEKGIWKRAGISSIGG
ncbi:pentatricopeptide repeat-containing protein At3g29230-like [Andrographis paniculata]|uniref:pentatricopeptide repeat-containing protein At3g29230-like n=1 Tax=Andrographis paniculata TaxID=175694 RepID=UPI0021E751B5|nr:pentatricopeptide repeat-containing protein At3g29230-like [Andrographis paniculata]